MSNRVVKNREEQVELRLLRKARDRILSRVEYDTNGGCWLWPGGSSPATTYGVVKIRPHASPFLNHRVVFVCEVGPIPPDLYVLHRCDVRPCCNPAHLFVGTPKDNLQDCAAKGRVFLQTHGFVYSGDLNPNAKLTWDQARELRRLFAEGVSRKDLAKMFGIGGPQVHKITVNRAFVE